MHSEHRRIIGAASQQSQHRPNLIQYIPNTRYNHITYTNIHKLSLFKNIDMSTGSLGAITPTEELFIDIVGLQRNITDYNTAALTGSQAHSVAATVSRSALTVGLTCCL